MHFGRGFNVGSVNIWPSSGAIMAKCLMALGAAIASVNAAAGQAGWSAAALVETIEPTSQRKYTVSLQLEAAHDCKSKRTFYQDYSANGAQFVYDTLLMALAHELPVQVHTSGRCELNGYAEITAVRIAR